MSGVAVVILAAGTSSRLGRPKQLLRLAGAPLVAHVARAARESDASRVMVVLGAHADKVRAAVHGIIDEFVTNEAFREGQGTSIASPIDYVDILAGLYGRIDAVVYLLADEPGVQPEIIDAVIRAWRNGGKIVMAHYRDRAGHPVLFDRQYWKELEELEGDQGGRHVIARHPDDLVFVPVDADAPMDVDTEADWRRLQEWWLTDEE